MLEEGTSSLSSGWDRAWKDEISVSPPSQPTNQDVQLQKSLKKGSGRTFGKSVARGSDAFEERIASSFVFVGEGEKERKLLQ